MKMGHLFLLAFGVVFGMFLLMLIIKGCTGNEPSEAEEPAAFFNEQDDSANERPDGLPSDEDSRICLANLDTLATACHAYTTIGRRQMYPPSLRAIVAVGLSFDRKALRCPADTNGEEYTSYESAFDIAGRELSNDAIPGDMMMIWDSVPRHSGARCVVLFNLKALLMQEDDFQGQLLKLREKLHELRTLENQPRDSRPRGNDRFEEEIESLLNIN